MAVLNSLTSPGSRQVYQFALNQFITWYCSEPRLAFNRIVVVRYRMYLELRRLAANTINQQLAAVRRLAHEAADAGLLSPDLAAGISRVRGVKQLGQRSGQLAKPGTKLGCATLPTARPDSFPLGSLESRAAARALAQTKARRLEFTPGLDAAVADPLTWLQQHTRTRDNHWRESNSFPDR